MTLLVMLMVFVYDYEIMHIVDCTTISMLVDGDLIWESCISDDQQDFNHTRCDYGEHCGINV